MKFVNFILKVTILCIIILVLVEVLENSFGSNDLGLVIYFIGILIFFNLVQDLLSKNKLVSAETKSSVQRESDERNLIEKKRKTKKIMFIALLVFLLSIFASISSDPRSPVTGLFVLITMISGTVIAYSVICFVKDMSNNIFNKDLFKF